MWVAIKLRIRLYHRSILLVSGSPSQCMEFHCGDNKMVKRKENYIYKKKEQHMCNWSFFRLPFCVSFLTFHGVCETVSHFSSSSSSSSRSKTVHSISLKPPAQRVDGTWGGEGAAFMFKSR